MDLTEFLSARLDEDEAVAKAAGGSGPDGQWARHEDEVGTGYGHLYDVGGDVVVYDEGAPGDLEFDHIARHDPARVLREVAAKRAVIEVYEAAAASDDPKVDYSIGMATMRMVLRSYATVWSGHPDYRPEWKP